MTGRRAEPRRWRLRAWDDAKQLVHDSTCVGDAELDATMKGLEQQPQLYVRIAAAQV